MGRTSLRCRSDTHPHDRPNFRGSPTLLGSLDREEQDRWAPGGSINRFRPAFECEADAGDEGEPDDDVGRVVGIMATEAA